MNSGSHHTFSFYHWEGSNFGQPVIVGEISVFSYEVSFWVMSLVLGDTHKGWLILITC
jgi:hypothetical protein